MFRNQYDNDVTTWSPQGRLHQLEYAMEAVKQGSAAVGIKSKTHAVLASLKRAPSELSAYQKKTFQIDDHVGITISGLTADARTLSRFMQTECMNHKYAFDVPLPVSRLVSTVGNRLQRSTIGYGRRPFGVGILVAGHDARGPAIYQVEPSSNFFSCKAQAIGARSQSARTYLERNLDKFPESSVEQLVQHSLRALRDCLPAEVELNDKNTCLSIVGPDRPFTTWHGEELQAYLDAIDGDLEGGAAMEEEAAAAADEAAPMEAS
mmetsp:Transcript_5853/g.14882  ORF Transcript_5853/g.14882 Transcript_5853/m.14882 type:complete len:264 (-) Transcript_5853:88-879(-)